ncbi:MAG: hypothetical protein ACK54V_04775 [Candidatus Kapaibacterium sp.]
MGTSFTIDTPIRLAHYGITSVVSLIDHRMIEQVREHYCTKYNIPFVEIPEAEEDCKARRVTAYLNMMSDIVDRQFADVVASPFQPGSEITKYFELLPSSSPLRERYQAMLSATGEERIRMENSLRADMRPGDIDGNIMTKVDSATYAKGGEPLPQQFNDAHASLRGFAMSKLSSSLVFSAGMNPRLYGYIAQFNDFFPSESGEFKKKIILKVSDYRSALIQGKFLAKKGLWVSEFRIESGLNCGGHAFASDGYLLGPIMQEFHDNRAALAAELFDVLAPALRAAERPVPASIPNQRLTVQGGVGTEEEQDFLFERYGVDSVGWGTPFLLCPEAVCIDTETMNILVDAKEEDLYLSKISPLGVPFNSVKGNTAELELRARIAAGKPGAACLKKHLISTTEFTAKPICTASIQFQRHKLDEWKELEIPADEKAKSFNAITQKTCLCVGLGNAALKAHGLEMYKGSQGVAVCPGPNMAYYNKVVTLREMVDHIYGRTNIIERTDRPNFFVKELGLYVAYLRGAINDCGATISDNQRKYFESFRTNLLNGIEYYRTVVPSVDSHFVADRENILRELDSYTEELRGILPAVQPVVGILISV